MQTHIDFHPEQARPTHGHSVGLGEHLDPDVGQRPIIIGFSYAEGTQTATAKYRVVSARFARDLARKLLAAADDADGNG